MSLLMECPNHLCQSHFPFFLGLTFYILLLESILSIMFYLTHQSDMGIPLHIKVKLIPQIHVTASLMCRVTFGGVKPYYQYKFLTSSSPFYHVLLVTFQVFTLPCFWFSAYQIFPTFVLLVFYCINSTNSMRIKLKVQDQILSGQLLCLSLWPLLCC